MGISHFKTRFDLLLEKAQLKENDFDGNEYTKYGDILEPQIREYINKHKKEKFEPNTTICGDLRANTDGFNGECVLEIKTTSNIYETVDEYKVYLVQLLFYMQINKVDKGMLAVYARPSDFNTTFDVSRLQMFKIDIKNYSDLLGQINSCIDCFRADLKRLKENPLLTEEELLNTDLTEVANKVVMLETKLQEYKAIEAEAKEMKAALLKAMQEYNVKKWTTNGGVQITKVDATADKPEKVFDEQAFKDADPVMYNKFVTDKMKKGRAAYIKITLPKFDSKNGRTK